MRQANPIQKQHQVTVRREVEISGVGLHSGDEARIVIKPALPNTGILFIRADLAERTAIPATFDHVTQTKLATTIGKGAASISTVEHLLCAFKLLGVDNATVEVYGAEVPIMDGSADPFCVAIHKIGLYDQSISKRVAVIKKKIEVCVGDKVATVEPSTEFKIDAQIEWNHPVIRSQSFSFTVGKTHFEEISKARTFGFLKDVEALQKMGLARGGSYDNAVVLDETKVLNPHGLRYPDEFVRHKVLDAIGDFALSPLPFIGAVSLVKAGHEMHRALVAEIFSDPANYEIRNLSELVAKPVAARETEAAFSWLDLPFEFPQV